MRRTTRKRQGLDLEGDVQRLRSFQAKSMTAYESGRLAEGDRLAAKADVLVEKIDAALMALEEEGEEVQAPIIQSITREMAEAWHSCMHDPWSSECRRDVEAYRRTGHGEWKPETVAFVGPLAMWGKVSAAERPEWHERQPGHYQEPHLIGRLRDIVGNREADGLLLLDAAEDAWNANQDVIRRIRFGRSIRRGHGIDPLTEAKRFAIKAKRRKKRTSRRALPGGESRNRT